MPRFPFPYSKDDLEFFHGFYDSRKSLIRLPLSQVSRSKKYLHKRLYLHPTRESLDYAFLLLSEEVFLNRAESILKTICDLQNKDSSSSSYGGWPKYSESTFLRKSGEYWKFDRNWTEFISLVLLEILIEDKYSKVLDSALIDDMRLAVYHAAQAIKSRNVPHVYTNICVMGLCVTLMAAHLFKDDDLYRHGKHGLDIFYSYTMSHGCFAEYNSTTYSLLTVYVLFYLKTRLRENFSTDQCLLRAVEHLYCRSYLEIACFFHLPTGQWAGPHSRSYSPLIDIKTKGFLVENLPDLIENSGMLGNSGMDELSFLSQRTKVLTRCMPYKNPAQITRTCMTPTFSLGSVNYSDLWSQRNALIAYWGSQAETYYCRLRCLHNHQDFSAAQLFSVQERSMILGAINFATDVAKENPYLPQPRSEKQGIQTYDLRIRFEFGGSSEIPDLLQIAQDNKDVVVFVVNSKYFRLSIPYVKFGSQHLRYEVTRCEETQTVNFDIVFYSGWIKHIEFSKIDIALFTFCFQIADEVSRLSEVPISVDVSDNENSVVLQNDKLSLSVIPKPGKLRQLREHFSNFTSLESQPLIEDSFSQTVEQTVEAR